MLSFMAVRAESRKAAAEAFEAAIIRQIHSIAVY